ncbi:MAG: hypothetical protein A2289_12625 [Deltaproteobacteria bacterium RIFOXYA12_FULL_58_15]|nr:MAG: hypothetical protein A2289_12625 [Deltaproteobacteria bacterium RIFOXYA12_FULL_58_15]OGR08841.1 MAG: hypothetical protein A2341_27900 [Deltaproteobacteria bacterium RIFOXYB12_FULL_58_9]
MDGHNKLRDLAVSDSGFVFDPYTGSTFSVNLTGLTILRGLKEGHGREDIVGELQTGFAAGDADYHRDLDEFVGQLRNQGLLPLDFSVER